MDTSPSQHFIYAMRPHFEKVLPEAVDLSAVYDMALRERADSIWEAAIEESPQNLGKMIHAMRVRAGESMERFGETLAAVENRSKPFDAHTVMRWEQNKSIPKGTQRFGGEHGRMCDAIVKLAKCREIASNPLSQSIQQPWFTQDMEMTFKAAFVNALEPTNTHGIYPEIKLSPPLDAKTIPPKAHVMQGSLDGQIINRKERPTWRDFK